MRVAIIGAGSAGMAMAKQIVDICGDSVPFVVFDRRSEVGGIWQHEAETPPGYLAWEDDEAMLHAAVERGGRGKADVIGAGTNEGGVKNDGKSADDPEQHRRRVRLAWATRHPPGPMFRGLRTNIPSDLMTFRDAPFPQGTSLYPEASTVQQYLEDYATKQDLRRHVRFNTSVKHVCKRDTESPWVVTSQGVQAEAALANGDTFIRESFTHLVLAHGRCNTPNIPNIPGLDTFTGRTIHSQWYRDPTALLEPSEPRRVLVLGNNSSAMDISRELSGFVTRTLPCGIDADSWQAQCEKEPFEVLQSWHTPDKAPMMDYDPRDPASPQWCQSIKVVACIERIQGSRIYLVDGTVLEEVPLIIFGTGYLFDNAFMDQSCGPLRTHPLLPPSKSPTCQGFPSPSIYNLDDWFLLHSQDETLAMLGLPVNIVPFPFTQIQAAYVIHRWLGRAAKLPRVNPDFAQNDPDRWTSRFEGNGVCGRDDNTNVNAQQNGKIVLRTLPHVFGSPSGNAYLDALLRMLHDNEEAGQVVPWAKDYERNSDGEGNGQPRGPEGLWAVSPWRRERRVVGQKLRRQVLGY